MAFKKAVFLCFSKSKIFLYLLISFIVGVAIASFMPVPYFYLFIFFVLSFILIVLFWKNKPVRIIFFSLSFFLLGIFRFQANNKNINSVEGYREMTGLIYEEPEKGNSQKIKFISNETKILITADLYPQYHYGDEIKIEGEIEKPENFESFDYRSYLSRYDIYLVSYKPKIEYISSNHGNVFLDQIYKFRNNISSLIKTILKEPESSVFQAMALGIKSDIPKEIKDDFSKAGVSHIIAISGLHITIIAGILMNVGLGIYLSRRQAFWFAIVGLFLFIVLVGMPASAVRAGIMGFLVLLAMYLGRLNNSTNAFVLAGSLMLLVNPKLLRYDIGFQLSFLAVLGLIYVGPFFKKFVKKVPDLFNIKSTILMTLSAQVFTLPLIIYYFQRISIIAPLANVMILPVLPFVLIFGFSGSIFSLIFLPLGEIIFWPCYLLLKYITFITTFLADISWSSFEINSIDFTFILLIYVFIFVILKIARLKNAK